jgi:hypothetical protein
MLTAAVLRSEAVRKSFSRIAWVNMSQKPDLLQLQSRLYQQLHMDGDKMPKQADSVQSRLDFLCRACVGRVVLICLDDVWDSAHERCFACIDTETASRLLITTRIKGILQGATQVELGLLGLQEVIHSTRRRTLTPAVFSRLSY